MAMTPEEEAALQAYMDAVANPMNAAANEYGPGWTGTDEDLYKGLGYNVSGLKDIGSIAGIRWADFAGVPEAPVAPDWTPYESDFLQIRGNDPILKWTSELIQRGKQPVEAARLAFKRAETEGLDVGGLVPDDVATEAMTYATELARQNREQSRFADEQSRFENYSRPSTEWADEGLTGLTADDWVERLAGDRQGYGAVKKPEPLLNGVMPNLREGSERFRALLAGEKPTAPRRARGVESLVDPRDRGTVLGDRRLEDTKKIVNERMAGKQNKVTPSQSELANRARLQAAYTLIFGSPAPTTRG